MPGLEEMRGDLKDRLAETYHDPVNDLVTAISLLAEFDLDFNEHTETWTITWGRGNYRARAQIGVKDEVPTGRLTVERINPKGLVYTNIDDEATRTEMTRNQWEIALQDIVPFVQDHEWARNEDELLGEITACANWTTQGCHPD